MLDIRTLYGRDIADQAEEFARHDCQHWRLPALVKLLVSELRDLRILRNESDLYERINSLQATIAERDREAVANRQQVRNAMEDAALWYDRLSQLTYILEDVSKELGEVKERNAFLEAQLAIATVEPTPADHVRAQDHD